MYLVGMCVYIYIYDMIYDKEVKIIFFISSLKKLTLKYNYGVVERNLLVTSTADSCELAVFFDVKIKTNISFDLRRSHLKSTEMTPKQLQEICLQVHGKDLLGKASFLEMWIFSKVIINYSWI